MKIYIVIPAHNEEDSIALTLDSLVKQTLLPEKIVVVDDNSTDNTLNIIEEYSDNFNFIESVAIQSSEAHIPGSKVVNAFNQGLKSLDSNYDIICKFDADLIFPNNYLETIVGLFNQDEKVGVAGGLPYIENNGAWKFEAIASKDHVRGPLKAYRKQCFEDIGGLRPSIGWDSVDVLLAQYAGWKIQTDKTLHVKHLKPTGISYHSTSKYLQGEALYKMRSGLILTLIASLKGAFARRSLSFFFNSVSGYFKAKKQNLEYMVTEDQGKFIRSLRWKNIRKRLF